MTVQNDLVPGSNQAPLAEVLAEETAALAKRRDELLAAVGRTVDIGTPEYAGKVADLARMVGACIKAAEDAHKERKEPYLRDGRAVDAAYKREIIEPLAEAKETLAASLAGYQHNNDIEQVRGELGSVSTLREEWSWEWTDRFNRFDFSQLERYFSPDAVDKAIRAAIKDGLRELKGVRIYKTHDVTIR